MKKRRRGVCSAYAKDIRREIKKSISRFLAVFLIVALGTGFFAGIKATMPDMKESAAEFFEDNRLMDLKLVSNVGFRYSDLQAVEDIDSIRGIEAAYSCDVYYNYEGQNQVVKVMSYDMKSDTESDSYLNRPILIEGRMPEKNGECVVENTMKTPASYVIGNTLKLTSPSPDNDILDYFTTDTFEIVGIVASPLYIGYERDATTIGNGTVNSFIIIPEDDFAMGYYTELYISFNDTKGVDPFSDKYTELVDTNKDEIVSAFEQSVGERLDGEAATALSQLSSAQSKLDEYELILSLDEAGLERYSAELTDKISQLQIQVDGGAGAVTRIALAQKQKTLETVQALSLARQSGDTSVEEAIRAEIESSGAEIELAREQLESIPQVKIYEFTRDSSSNYASFAGDSEKIDAIAKVFPVFFVFIAALVCVTTMTRMVDEKRTEIGTYKALGYSRGRIVSKYLVYALVPTVSGSLIGTAIGFKVFPYIIYNSYKIIYNIPSIDTPFRVSYAVYCMLTAIVCVGAAVIASCYAALKAQPAQLMRPKAPPAGKRVFLERIGFLWKRLGFLTKVTLRNLLRYKKRFAMTLIGVAGCTALIMTAFGIKNSISKIVDLQFGRIFDYDAITVINNSVKAEDGGESDVNGILAQNAAVSSFMRLNQTDCVMSAGGDSYNAQLIVTEEPQRLEDFVRLRDCKTGEKLNISGGEIVITEKISQLLGVSVGDEVQLEMTDRETVTLRVDAIAENYAMHYVYMSPEVYEKLYGAGVIYNQAFIKLCEGADRTAFSEELIAKDEFLGLMFLDDKADSFFTSIDSLNSIVWLLIACAALLAFIVLYNLANINITERVREIATLKVLGFYDGETSAYIYRENIFTTVIGIVIGWGAGLLLHAFVVKTAEVDIVMFAREMVWYAYILSALLTAVFSALINVVLHFKLRKIDMVQSLKSIE